MESVTILVTDRFSCGNLNNFSIHLAFIKICATVMGVSFVSDLSPRAATDSISIIRSFSLLSFTKKEKLTIL